VSLATVCRRLASLVGVQPADTWIGNPDLTASEIVAWVQEAQQAVASAYDWATLTKSLEVAVAAGSGVVAVPLPTDVAQLVPDSVYLGQIPVTGPLTQPEWQDLLRWPSATFPAFTLAGGQLQLSGAGLFGPLAYRYVAAVPDYTADPQETALGAGVPELVRLFESCVLYAALAAYRDAKGLPAGTAAAQASALIADAKGRDQPVGALSLSRHYRWRRHGFTVIGTGSGGGGGGSASVWDGGASVWDGGASVWDAA
jgi:hypothetical protein